MTFPNRLLPSGTSITQVINSSILKQLELLTKRLLNRDPDRLRLSETSINMCRYTTSPPETITLLHQNLKKHPGRLTRESSFCKVLHLIVHNCMLDFIFTKFEAPWRCVFRFPWVFFFSKIAPIGEGLGYDRLRLHTWALT